MGQSALAQESLTTLNDTHIVDRHTLSPQQDKTDQDLARQFVSKGEDLVRYEADMAEAQSDEFGSKGYSIRGVSGNRVALIIDGIALPDSQENELAKPYGKQNSARASINFDMLQSVTIERGANSFNASAKTRATTTAWSRTAPYCCGTATTAN